VGVAEKKIERERERERENMQILCKFYANEIYLCPELDKE